MIQPIAAAAARSGLTQALCAAKQSALDRSVRCRANKALSHFVKNFHCCGRKSIKASTPLILLAHQADSRLTPFPALRSLQQQSFTGMPGLHNYSFVPTPLRGAAQLRR